MTSTTENLLGSLLSFNVTASMRGEYGGSVTLDNSAGLQGPDDVHVPIRGSVSVSGYLAGCGSDPQTDWLYGVITSVDEGEDSAPDSQVSFQVSSFPSRAARLPLVTEKGSGNDPKTLLTRAMQLLGVPSSLYDFSAITATAPLAKVHIQGDNALEELKKFCRAFGADMFVNEAGILVAEPWKDENSAVDFVIPPEAVVNAQRQTARELGPSIIKVIGRYYSNMEEPGTDGAPANNNAGNNQPKGGNANPMGGGNEHYCSSKPVWKKDAVVRIVGRAGGGDRDALALENADFDQAAGDGVLNWVEGIQDNYADVNYDVSSGATAPGEDDIEPNLKGKQPLAREHEAPGVEDRNAKVGKDGLRDVVHKLAVKVGKAAGGKRGGGAGGGGKGGGGSSQTRDKSSVEREPTRIEMICKDTALLTEFGVREEEIDNPYVPNQARALELATRTLKEFKMARRAWEVNLGYVPCLQLNTVVTFTVPNTGESVTGLLVQVGTDYNAAGPECAQSVVVESFEDAEVICTEDSDQTSTT